jgi:hypothetical protein
MALKDYSTTPANNALVGSVNFSEGQAPSTVNDSARQLMADIKAGVPLVVDTTADMKALTKADLSQGVQTAVSDAQGGYFFWSSTSTETANDITVFESNEGGTGRWKRIYDGTLNAAWGGFLTTNTAAQNKTALDALISASLAGAGGIFIPPGTYECNALDRINPDTASTRSSLVIRGTSPGRAGFSATIPAGQITKISFPNLSGSDVAIPLGYTTTGANDLLYGAVIENMLISGPSAQNVASPSNTTTGLECRRAPSMTFNNVQFEQFHTGVEFNDCWNLKIDRLSAARCHIGFYGTSQLNSSYIGKLDTILCHYGAVIDSGDAITIDFFNCEESEYGLVIGTRSSLLPVSNVEVNNTYFEDIGDTLYCIGYIPDGSGGLSVSVAGSNGLLTRNNILRLGRFVDAGANTIADVSAGVGGLIAFRGHPDEQNSDRFTIDPDAAAHVRFSDYIFSPSAILERMEVARSGPYYDKLVLTKDNVAHNTADSALRFTVRNSGVQAVFKIMYELENAASTFVAGGEIMLVIRRGSGAGTRTAIRETITELVSDGGFWSAITFSISSVSGATSETQTFDLEITQTNSSSNTAKATMVVDGLASGNGSNALGRVTVEAV